MILPTIFEKDFSEIKRKIKLVEGVADMIQIDFADGKLVDGETFLEIENTYHSITVAHIKYFNPLFTGIPDNT